ncbi:MAG: hypothetical protein KAS32_28880 [Candidatus Peribacteraceae bacterium]|nr:hypothetical protein [Candidatus Peribacteraceae bacterium]
MTQYKILSYVPKDDMFVYTTDHPIHKTFVYKQDEFKDKKTLEREINNKIKEMERRDQTKKEKIDKVKEELDA